MEWGDRDWAEIDEPEQGVLYDPEPSRAPTARAAHISIIGAVVVLASLGCVAAGQLPRHHPIIPAFSFRLPQLRGADAASQPAASIGNGRSIPLGGSPVATDPSTYTLYGQTASTDGMHVTGKVVLRGRWDHGPWLVLDKTETDADGRFRVASKLRRRGLLELRLLLPDGFVRTKSLRVR
jgi:hypothetical protein